MGGCSLPLYHIDKELAAVGFIMLGADPIKMAMEHKFDELYLEIGLMKAAASTATCS
jgi:hypothetical protein